MFNPENFLNVGRTVINTNTFHTEEFFRTAISRVYYAAFLVGQNELFIKKNIRLTKTMKRQIHMSVINQLKKVDITTANKLNTLRRWRIASDYIMSEKIDLSLIKTALTLSEEVIKKLHQLP